MTIMREERAQDAHDLDNVTYNLAVVVALHASVARARRRRTRSASGLVSHALGRRRFHSGTVKRKKEGREEEEKTRL